MVVSQGGGPPTIERVEISRLRRLGVARGPEGRREIQVRKRRSQQGWLREQVENSTVSQGQCVNGLGGSLARRRHQRGTLLARTIKAEDGSVLRTVWVGRWREDEIAEGRIHRVRRSEVLGEKKEGDLPTRALARRRLEERLAVVNDPMYRARPVLDVCRICEAVGGSRAHTTQTINPGESSQPSAEVHHAVLW